MILQSSVIVQSLIPAMILLNGATHRKNIRRNIVDDENDGLEPDIWFLYVVPHLL